MLAVTIDLSSLGIAVGQTVPVTVTAQGASGPAALPVSASTQVSYSALSLPVRSQWYGGDLHVHTAWSDGTASLDSRVKDAKANGFGFIAITDHAGNGKWLDANSGSAFLSYVAEANAAQQTYGILVEPGIELASVDSGHVLGYDINQTQRLTTMIDDILTASEIFDKVASSNYPLSFASVAHPYGFYPFSDWADSAKFRSMELISGESAPKAATMTKWFELLQGDLQAMAISETPAFHVGVAGSDAHWPTPPGDSGFNWLWTDVYYQGRAAILNSIKAGHISASSGKDLGVFAASIDPSPTRTYVVQGNLLKTGTSRTVYFKVVQQPVSGRVCTRFEVKDKSGTVVYSQDNPTSQETYFSVPVSQDNFYLGRSRGGSSGLSAGTVLARSE